VTSEPAGKPVFGWGVCPVAESPSEGPGGRLWSMVAEHAAGRGRRAGVADACAVAVQAARVSGAGLTVMTPTDSGRVVCVTDDISARIEELQLTFGEGPCMDAYTSGSPVLTADLRSSDAFRRWPAFAPAASEVGAAAVYAFPLQMGAARLGVMDLYHVQPRSLDSGELRDALLLADTTTLLLVGREVASLDHPDAGAVEGLLSEREGYRAEIDQATGMITIQLGVGIEEAFVRLRAYAYARDRSLTEVARDVVARRLRFAPDPPADLGGQPGGAIHEDG
jgi:ANTAR domain/GAF domain